MMALSSLLLCASLLLAAALVPQVARAHSAGPPVKDHFAQICDLMTPLHHNNVPIANTGGYSIETDVPRNGYIGFNYTAGKDYTGEKRRANSVILAAVRKNKHGGGEINLVLHAHYKIETRVKDLHGLYKKYL